MLLFVCFNTKLISLVNMLCDLYLRQAERDHCVGTPIQIRPCVGHKCAVAPVAAGKVSQMKNCWSVFINFIYRYVTFYTY